MLTTANLRRRNEQKIHAQILSKGPISRKKLVELTGLTGAAISRITRDMITDGILIEGDGAAANGRLGRREVELSANPGFRYVLGLTITGDRRSLVLSDSVGGVVQEADITVVDISDPKRSLKEIAEAAKAIIFEAGAKKSDVAGVGVSMPLAASLSDEMVTAPPINWRDVPVRSILAKSLGLPVKIEARPTSILRAELIRHAPISDSMFLINVAYGVGSSAYLNGQLVHPGTPGFGGITHFAIQGETAECSCGRQGCLEVCAGGRRVLDTLGLPHDEFDQRNRNIAECLASASTGNEVARSALIDAGGKLAFGVDAVLAMFDPSKIVISGEIGRNQHYFEGLLAQLKTLGRNVQQDRIVQSSIKSHDATIWMALQSFVAPEIVNVSTVPTSSHL